MQDDHALNLQQRRDAGARSRLPAEAKGDDRCRGQGDGQAPPARPALEAVMGAGELTADDAWRALRRYEGWQLLRDATERFRPSSAVGAPGGQHCQSSDERTGQRATSAISGEPWGVSEDAPAGIAGLPAGASFSYR
jgi:hypothetical protein